MLHRSTFLVARGDINPYIERRNVRERARRNWEREKETEKQGVSTTSSSECQQTSVGASGEENIVVVTVIAYPLALC